MLLFVNLSLCPLFEEKAGRTITGVWRRLAARNYPLLFFPQTINLGQSSRYPLPPSPHGIARFFQFLYLRQAHSEKNRKQENKNTAAIQAKKIGNLELFVMVSGGIEPPILALLARCLNQLGQETRLHLKKLIWSSLFLFFSAYASYYVMIRAIKSVHVKIMLRLLNKFTAQKGM
ncbi:hypothetical protein BZA70DRAFT_145641 [Myxozyma melibiosi]|uniref:Uncharacterized protein n=1 Tax=Myxozyma melibiosi TaxID=54550 RepID=A0ABR1F7P9_9ASCO